MIKAPAGRYQSAGDQQASPTPRSSCLGVLELAPRQQRQFFPPFFFPRYTMPATPYYLFFSLPLFTEFRQHNPGRLCKAPVDSIRRPTLSQGNFANNIPNITDCRFLQSIGVSTL